MIRDFLNTEDEPVRATVLPVMQDEPTEPAEEAAKLIRPNPCPLDVTDVLPVGMVYASMQTFTDLYAPEKALCRGTLFQALDLPFREGERR